MTSRLSLLLVPSLCVLVVLIVVLGFASCASAGADADAVAQRSLFRTASAVVDIADADLAKVHPSAGLCPWILVAYSDGCGHCRSAAPALTKRAQATFDNAADVLHGVTVAALNCQMNTEACRSLGVRGVPTFFLLTPAALPAKEATVQPLTLTVKDANGGGGGGEDAGGETPAETQQQQQQQQQQVLNRFPIGSGGGLDQHLDTARSIWATMSNASWSASSQERCVDMRSFLHNSKKSDIAARPLGTAPDAKATFREDTEFHTADVSNAFFYTLYHEVALVGLDTAERRYTLNRFLRAVQQRLPGLGADVLLHEMAKHTTMGDKPTDPADFAAYSVDAWQQLVLSAGIPFQGTARDLVWTTCKGSSWRHRGFPCGLWLMYHALTANAEANDPALAAAAAGHDGVSPLAEADKGGVAQANTEILFIIREYARHFFSCESCRINFMRFTLNRDEDPLWQLWRIHNAVNDRLASVTEGADPLVPKRQFPGRELCPLCYRDVEGVGLTAEQSVVATEMIRFLRQRYRWVPSTLRVSSYTTASPLAPTQTAMQQPGNGESAILVYRSPMSLNVVLTMAVVVIVVLFAMKYVLRRSRALKAKKHRPILPLRMQS